MFSANQIEILRDQTPGVQKKIHLNNAGAAFMPQQVISAITDHIHLEAILGGYESAALKADEIAGFYTATAELLHTKPHNIAFTNNATDSYIKALSSVVFHPGDVLLTSIDDYASNQISFLQLAKLRGINIVRAENTPKGGVDLSSMAELIKKHRPKLVAVTHVPTNSGLVQPVEAIGEMCKEAGILYLVDACQSVGQIDVNAPALHCDFLSVTMRKFLRGPRGAGFLYVSDRVLEEGLEPLFLDLHSAEWVEPDRYQAIASAKRFEVWEKPYALVLGSKAAMELALEIGMKNIEVRVQKLAAYCREQLAKIRGIRVLDTGLKRCGIVTLTLDALPDGASIKNQLAKANINTSLVAPESALIDFLDKNVKWALRVSPHYYNTIEEIDTFIGVFENVIKK